MVGLVAALVLPGPAAAQGRQVEVVVTLDGPSLTGAIRSSRVLTSAARQARISPNSPTSASYLRDLASTQDSVASRLERAVAGAHVVRSYGVVLNGLSVSLPAAAVRELTAVPGIARVWPTVRYRSQIENSPRMIGAPPLWGTDYSTAGNGEKIAIVDDGVDRTHPFFNPRGYAMPAGFPKGQRAYTSAKVIVARSFPPPHPTWRYARRAFDPQESVHGTHVAGIAAGNPITVAGRPLSGVAPRAYLGNYRVLTVPTASGVGLNGNSPEIAAGIEAAVRDGMDVINLSIGEAEIEPSRDLVVAAIDGATKAGVVVAVAAGNDFEEFGRGSVGSPGSARSAITAGAVTGSRHVTGFSSAGPTPVSLQLKPDVTAPGEVIFSSVPARYGTWDEFSGTSMAAPHVAGAAALLLQRHPDWTPADVKSALVQTADPILDGTPSTRQGAGLIGVGRAVTPRVFADPTGVSLGLLRPGRSAQGAVGLTDAGGGAGLWSVRLQVGGAPRGLAVRAPTAVSVPGTITLRAAAGAGAVDGEAWGWILLQQDGQSRRIPYWLRVARPRLPRPSSVLRKTGTYGGDNKRRPARVDVYRYPELPRGLPEARLAGPEQVFRVRIKRAVTNFGVAVLSHARGAAVSPRVVVAGDQNHLVGYTGLPFNLNPYLPEFLRPSPAAGAVRPAPGTYDVVFDSPSRRRAGRFTFRFWINDRTPPSVSLLSRSVARGTPLRVAVHDAGSGVDPASIHVAVDGQSAPARLRAGRLALTTAGLRPGRHRLSVKVSDYQETRNMENEPRILPNTRRLATAFTIR
jgi:subtilisin family serine protease